MELWQLDATDLATLTRSGKISAREATASHLKRLEVINPAINAVVHQFADEALADADRLDGHLASGGTPGTLHGVPITVKITADQKGKPSDNGVIAFRDVIASQDSPVVRNLRKAGAIIIGRTNSPAFAMRFMTENALHGRTLNPWNPDVTCGGSSGGAGAAVATGIGALAHGSDIGGSIRWPAFCNGVAGLRTSPGRIPSYNATARAPVPMAAQLMAVAGPMARSVRDLRLGLHVMASEGDPSDPLWIPLQSHHHDTHAPRRVALVTTHPGTSIHPACIDAVRLAGRHLASAGYQVDEVEPPNMQRVFELWETIGFSEISAALAPMLGNIGDTGLDKAFREWMAFARQVDVKSYQAALAERHALMGAWSRFFADHPLVITPVGALPSAAADQDTRNGGSAFMLSNFGRFLFLAPVLGLPALAMPVGTHDGLPMGVQIHAARYREDLCLAAGDIIEAHEGKRHPVTPSWL